MGLILADILKFEGLEIIGKKFESYHRLVHWPSWFDESIKSFENQVNGMASAKRPFKCSDTFKLQSGYPHELTKERKQQLIDNGCKRDRLSAKNKVNIPKLHLNEFNKFLNNKTNPTIFTTPVDSKFIRDITIIDDETHPDLAFVYVINRKAQVITAWCEPKTNGKHYLKLPKNIIKSSTYKRP